MDTVPAPVPQKLSEWEWELDEQHAVATILAEAHADLVLEEHTPSQLFSQ
eukprot:COSAG06_NODE_18655_length_881_cov_1.394330_1_plen_49_part_10